MIVWHEIAAFRCSRLPGKSSHPVENVRRVQLTLGMQRAQAGDERLIPDSK
ncbi:MAG: hypothetical protein GXP23_02475 [Gammaproteobacteria bacterium]|nr:hypothetical protein [Gammaproteobacteria bacterium]